MRTFDDIIPPSRRKTETGAPLSVVNGRPPLPPPPPRALPPGVPRRRFPYITIIVALVVIGVSIFALIRFSSAKVEILPMTTSVEVQGSYSAGASTALPFQIITAKKVATKSIAASGTKTVSVSASGPITIYNMGTKPQPLIATTRFATSAGLIYKIPKAIVVPAGTTDKPGSITATVIASAPGPTYNIGPSSFTLPGLAGSPQERTVYARSTEAMTGGVSGTVPAIDATVEQATATALQADLGKDLAQDIASQVPEGYELVSGASATIYRTLPAIASSASGKVDVQVEGTVTAVIFPSAVFAKSIANAVADPSYQGREVILGPGTSLTLTPSGGLPASDTESFTFSLSGTATLVATVDPMQIATAVAGKSKPEARVALSNYPEIERAVLVLRPFWRSAFPEDPASITVVVSTPTESI